MTGGNSLTREDRMMSEPDRLDHHRVPRPLSARFILTMIAVAVSPTGAGQAQDVLRRPTGQEYLAPAETVRRFAVPEGFEVKLVAGEPHLANPIAMAFDERGRLYVIECFEYPKGTPQGETPRDRIKILEDTDGDVYA